MRPRLRCTLVGALASLSLLAGALPAHADARCEAGEITINGGRGGEPASLALGHTHSTGNHYVVEMRSDGTWVWWADNNGGADGDTADTFYQIKQCS
ncbi:MAG: hypothetical protein ACRD0K_23095 [Egibacteraceae bacterium]